MYFLFGPYKTQQASTISKPCTIQLAACRRSTNVQRYWVPGLEEFATARPSVHRILFRSLSSSMHCRTRACRDKRAVLVATRWLLNVSRTQKHRWFGIWVNSVIQTQLLNTIGVKQDKQLSCQMLKQTSTPGYTVTSLVLITLPNISSIIRVTVEIVKQLIQYVSFVKRQLLNAAAVNEPLTDSVQRRGRRSPSQY